MKFYLKSLTLEFQMEMAVIQFSDVNYFHGKIGTGKSSIARLVDFCLGGKLIYTPALQKEFSSATLSLAIENRELRLTRNSREAQITAKWEEAGQQQTRILVAKENSGNESLSGLLFHLAKVEPPLIRGGQAKDEGELTFRDLLKFCFLDQESMDSDFFGLEREGTSRDVMRLLVGWHNEELLKLEDEMDTVQRRLQQRKATAQALKEALSEERLPSPKEIDEHRRAINARVDQLNRDIAEVRQRQAHLRPHGIEGHQQRGRALAEEIGAIAVGLNQIGDSIARDKTHLNTMEGLKDRKKRAEIAQTVLKEVVFGDCPACFLPLPEQSAQGCPLCGQADVQDSGHTKVAGNDLDADIEARVEDLKERFEIQAKELNYGKSQMAKLEAEKQRIDSELNEALKNYDSAYLSQAVEIEKEKSRLLQQLADLSGPENLAKRAERSAREAAELTGKQKELQTRLKDARERAEENRIKLERLKELFMDCLKRARLPGLDTAIRVELPNDFVPEAYAEGETKVHATFDNMGGGKKVFFKCCFGLAVHRLAAETKAIWPPLLILDSPMKSISERENKEQFTGFHGLLFELAQTELQGTQIILIDKEMVAPPQESNIRFQQRYMTTDDPNNPPLVPAYRGQ